VTRKNEKLIQAAAGRYKECADYPSGVTPCEKYVNRKREKSGGAIRVSPTGEGIERTEKEKRAGAKEVQPVDPFLQRVGEGGRLAWTQYKEK